MFTYEKQEKPIEMTRDQLVARVQYFYDWIMKLKDDLTHDELSFVQIDDEKSAEVISVVKVEVEQIADEFQSCFDEFLVSE